MLDKRRKCYHDIRRIVFFASCLLIGGLLNEYRHWLLQPSWESQQLVISEMVSPLPNGQIYAQEAPKPTPTPNPTETIKNEIKEVFGADSELALRVVKCESGFNPNARNKVSSARGLFQIMASVHGVNEKWLYNPSVNIRIAKQLFDRQGWTPWEASRHCWSK